MVEGRRQFQFVSHGLPDDTFEVVVFKGTEGISRLYEFDITLSSHDPDIDLKTVVTNQATLTIRRDTEDDDRLIHGIPAKFELIREADDVFYYRIILVPRLWQSDLIRENQLFLDKSIPDIIQEILEQAGLAGDDFEINATKSYPSWEYICQFDETDFGFISRWMERSGLYYYFEQLESFEKLIITDVSSRHEDLPDPYPYYPPSALSTTVEEVVMELRSQQRMLAKKVILKDYNYRKPDMEVKGEADVDPDGRGEVYIYGEHLKTPEEAKELAKIRAEELLCNEIVYLGESTCALMCPGFIYEQIDFYRDNYNQKYLVTVVEHSGDQSGALLARAESKLNYANRFTAIPATTQFRPERKTAKPQIKGTMHAKVDATGSGEYAEIDDEGRYKVKLFFDRSGSEDGKASRWVRMQQPYSGAEYGAHFPLHKGSEILLTFINGDPDRPIISGAVPNPNTMSPVVSGNQTQSVIKTGGGNLYVAEDVKGGEYVLHSTPCDESMVRIGAASKTGPAGLEIATKAQRQTKIGQDSQLEVGGNTKEDLKGNLDRKVLGDKKSTTIGTTTKQRIGDTKTTTVGNREKTVVAGEKHTTVGKSEQTKVAGENCLWVGKLDNIGVAGSTSIWIGTKSQVTIAMSQEVYVGGKTEVYVGSKSAVMVGGSTEIFVGSKTAISVAGATEIFVGIKMEVKVGGLVEMVLAAKLAVTVAASIELAAGPKLVNTPTGIKNEGIELSQSAIKNSLSGLTNFL